MIYVLIALIATLVGLQLLIRTNTAVVFFAVCAGSVLVSAAGKDTDLLAHSMGRGTPVSSNVVQALLVLLPAIISAFILWKRVPRGVLFIGIVPAFCAAVVGLSIVYPFLTPSFQITLSKGTGWSLIAQYYEVIVIVGIVSSLIMLAVTLPKHHKDDRHKKGRHH